MALNKKILLFSLKAPIDRLNGGDFRVWTLLNHGNATVVCLSKKAADLSGQPITKPLPWRSLHVIELEERLPPFSNTFWSDKNWLRHAPVFVARLRAALLPLLAENTQWVCVAYPFLSGLLMKNIFPGVRPAVDITDSQSLYFLRRYRYLEWNHAIKKLNALYQAWRWKRLECVLANHAGVMVTAGLADMAHLSSCAGNKVVAFGTGTDWARLPPIERKVCPSRPILAFYGGMGWGPNKVCARYLATELLPEIKAHFGKVELHLAGSGSATHLADLTSLKGVFVDGYVDDLRFWLRDKAVFVMPMFQGSGVKNKLLEAMAAGIAVVTNPMGAESLPASARKGVIIAEGKKALSDAVLDLLTDNGLRAKLEHKARAVAEQFFDPFAIAEEYQKMLKSRTKFLSVTDLQ